MKIPQDGGTVTPVTSVISSRGERLHITPSFLPDGKHFLYTRFSAESGGLYMASLDVKPDQQSLDRILDTFGQYASGHILFMRGGTLMAQGFDTGRSKMTGEAVPLVASVQSVPPLPGSQVVASGGVGSLSQLTWFDRHGSPLGTIGQPGVIWAPRVAPDNVTVAFTRFDTGPGEIRLYEPSRGEYQFTTNATSPVQPVWSSSGDRLAFVGLEGGGWALSQKAASGAGNEELLDKGETSAETLDWSRDNKYLFFGVQDPKTKIDIWVLPLDGGRKAFPYLNSSFNEDLARLSPDGKWLAYESDRLNGRFEVYVDTFTGNASRALAGSWRVSTDGGTRPVWSHDGKELFFINADRKMMAVDVASTGGTEFKFAAPKTLFDARISGNPTDQFDVSRDGRFLMPVPVKQGLSVPITVIVNWSGGLKP
jgi:Tol biopolymer transport system component